MPLADVTCDSGESATLRCKVCGRPRATVAWKGPNQSNLAGSGRFSTTYRLPEEPFFFFLMIQIIIDFFF